MAQGSKCRECGCHCRGRSDQTNLHLHVEIENLKQKLLERENHIITMESNFLTEVDKFPNGEFAALAEELLTWQDKYSRLYESHKRIQKVNQNLEDKLLKIVDKCETEKNALTRDVKSLKERLREATCNINWLKEENERNRNDVNLAIQLLQCKPSNFVSQKFESLPTDLQQKVKLYMSNKKRTTENNNQQKHEVKTIKVPIPTYPPTAMFYSVNKPSNDKENSDKNSGKPVDIVSAAIMAKILEEREKERQNIKHCSSCICPLQRVYTEQSTQTQDNSSFPNSFISNNSIIKVEAYQTNSATPSSAILYERSIVPTNLSQIPPSNSNKKSDTKILNLGRNRYYSSKISKEVGRSFRKEKTSDQQSQPELMKCSEISIDGGVRFSDVMYDVNGRYFKVNETVAIDMDPDVQMGASNILLDNATGFVPAFSTTRSLNSQALVHFNRSRSTSESTSSNEDNSVDSRKNYSRTETEI